MGKKDVISLKKFTQTDVLNKNMVIEMLTYEEQLTKSEYGKELYSNTLNKPLISLNVEKTLNRLTLTQFGFNTSDESVENYRTIFKTYFKSPTNYDKDVIHSVHYMRENKCVYYTNPPLNIGDKIPNCSLYNLDGETKTTLHDIINKKNAKYTVIAAFSLS
jgi:hypothetical protein